MKLKDTDAFDNFSLYLDIMYFSAIKYLYKDKSTKVKMPLLIDYLIEKSPIIIGKVNRWYIEYAVKDIYKKCYKNNHKNVTTIKLSRKHLEEYLEMYSINIEGISWL